MAPRANWKGLLRVGEVTCPVALYTAASTSDRIVFHTLTCPSTTSRKTVGSLLLGLYDDGRLDHVGRVGTGFSDAVIEDLLKRMTRLKVETSPFAGKLTADEVRLARYVQPELVAEIEFRSWTADGQLRHASFRGLREDKPAREIVRKVPKAKATAGAKTAPPPNSAVQLTHGDRVYWPDAGVTREGLADYYSEVWRWTRTKVPSAVETVFAVQKHRLGLFVRTIGLGRAHTKIGLANLAYNLKRFLWIRARPVAA